MQSIIKQKSVSENYRYIKYW